MTNFERRETYWYVLLNPADGTVIKESDYNTYDGAVLAKNSAEKEAKKFTAEAYVIIRKIGNYEGGSIKTCDDHCIIYVNRLDGESRIEPPIKYRPGWAPNTWLETIINPCKAKLRSKK